jgi:hypothetical protein
LDDVKLGVQFEFKELRVVTADHRHGVLMLNMRHHAPLLGLFAAEQDRALASARDDVRRGLLNPSDFGHEALHRVWLRLSASLGFHYWREQS